MEEYNFAGQKKDEKVVLVMKQHPWVMVKPGLKIILMAVCATILVKVALIYTSTMSWTYLIAIFTFVLIVITASKNYFIWQNSLFVLTSKRIILVDQNGWFSRIVSEANLENILFVNHEVTGPIRTMLNFGDLNIRASGVSEDEMIFYDVYNPYDIQQAITHAQEELVQNNEDTKKDSDAESTKLPDHKKHVIR